MHYNYDHTCKGNNGAESIPLHVFIYLPNAESMAPLQKTSPRSEGMYRIPPILLPNFLLYGSNIVT